MELIKTKIVTIRQLMMAFNDQFIFQRAYDFGLEEFIEAIGFYWFLAHDRMPTHGEFFCSFRVTVIWQCQYIETTVVHRESYLAVFNIQVNSDLTCLYLTPDCNIVRISLTLIYLKPRSKRKSTSTKKTYHYYKLTRPFTCLAWPMSPVR